MNAGDNVYSAVLEEVMVISLRRKTGRIIVPSKNIRADGRQVYTPAIPKREDRNRQTSRDSRGDR